MSLAEMVKDDIIAFLDSNDELLFNERDLQMHLVVWLKNSPNAYDDVDLEYYVPYAVLDNYLWKSELRMDIVVKKDGEYLPVELKYKTKAVKCQIKRFGQDLTDKDGKSMSVLVVKNQGAHDLGLYDFWKDVRRIELVRNQFEHIKEGLAVFLTNNPAYKKCPRSTSNNFLFSMSDGTHPTKKHWQNPDSKSALTHPDFEVMQNYKITWRDTVMQGVEMHYCIVTV